MRKVRERRKRSVGGRINGRTTGRNEKRRKEVGGKRREEGSADMPVYLGISCVKGGRGERRGGGRVEKEVESSTTLVGVTLEEVEQMLLQEKKGGGVGEGECQCQFWLFSFLQKIVSQQLSTDSFLLNLIIVIIGKWWMLPGKHAEMIKLSLL